MIDIARGGMNDAGGSRCSGAGRIAVLRALQLGDMLCAVPALRAVREAFPQAHVTLIGLPWARAFAARYARYVDDFLEFAGFPGLPEREARPAEVLAFLAEAQRRRFDLAIQLHGSGRHVNECVQLLGARRSAGFHAAGDVVPDPARFLPWPEEGTEVQRLLRLVEHLGIAPRGEALEFPLLDRDVVDLETAPGVPAPGTPFCCVHPGARFGSRRWPAERFAAVADALAREGLRVVLTGVASEAEVTARVRTLMHAEAIDLTGQLSLGALAALVERADVVICNDTGMSHVAAAVGTPSVVVSSGSDAPRWAPGDRHRHVMLWADAPCRPCMHVECPVGHYCAHAIGVDDVVTSAISLLTRTRRPIHAS